MCMINTIVYMRRTHIWHNASTWVATYVTQQNMNLNLTKRSITALLEDQMFVMGLSYAKFIYFQIEIMTIYLA